MKKSVSGILQLFLITLSIILTIPSCIQVEMSTKYPISIKIGFFSAETTASLFFYSPWSKSGFELGIKYATNNTNTTLLDQPYEIIYYDTKGLVSDAKALARAAIERDDVSILVGGTYSPVAEAISEIAKEYQKLYFITPAASSELTGAKFNPYTFRISRNSWHDALAGINYAMDTLGAHNFSLLAADYSFGYKGAETMTKVITEKNGSVVLSQYADLATSDFTPYIDNILNADKNIGIDYLLIIWSGNFGYLYSDLGKANVTDHMSVGGSVIDIYSINVIEESLKPFNVSLEGARGFCVYGYELPDNLVNNWMVSQHIEHNIRPAAAVGYNYRVPELFSAGGFATAQFLVNVTNEVPSLDIYEMINHLESNLTVETPKGLTYLRPEDHQGLAEMYISEIWKDNRLESETYNLLIPKLVERLDPQEVAPPIESIWIPGSLTKPEKANLNPLIMLMGLICLIIIQQKSRKQKSIKE